MATGSSRKTQPNVVKTSDKYSREPTEEQRRIIDSRQPLAEVRAYAGTGKTYTLVKRFNKLLERGATVDQILVLTFSNAGVDTLVERLPVGAVAQTFHSYGLQQVRAAGDKSKVIDGKAELPLVKKAIKAQVRKSRKSLPEEARFMKGVAKSSSELSFLQQFFDLVTAGKSMKSLTAKGENFHQLRPYLEFLVKAYRRLQKLKRDLRLITFADMIPLAVKALAKRKMLGIKHMLVDEYQDCTPAQTLLIQALGRRVESLMVFGDPTQTIFGFAGAEFTALANVLPGARTYRLTRSFRLNNPNAALATVLLRQRDRHTPPVVGDRGPGRRPQLIKCSSQSAQSSAVVQIVRRLIAGGAKANEIVVLARLHMHLHDVDKALLDAGIDTDPLHRDRSRKPLLRALKTQMALDRLPADLPNKERNQRLDKVLAGIAVNRVVPASTLMTCRRTLVGALLSKGIETRLRACIDVHLTLQGGKNAVGPDVQDELMRWVPKSRPFESAGAFRDYVKTTRRASRVRTSTIHGAKGKEWQHVIVLHVVDGCLPDARHTSPLGLQAEHNLFYVAATRAMQLLFLMQAPFTKSNRRGSEPFDKPSRFVGGIESSVLHPVRV